MDQVIRPSLLQTKIQDKVKAEFPVTDAQVKDYYDKNKTQFITPDARQVHYVITASRADALAAHTQLEAGANWSKVYKKYSLDYSASTPACATLAMAKGSPVRGASTRLGRPSIRSSAERPIRISER